jgi:hypothetical protein
MKQVVRQPQQLLLIQILPPVINNVLIVDTQCGQSTGKITVQASGGVAPLMYSLNNGPFGTSNVFTGLASGIYTVHVKGANQCEVTQVVTVISVGAQTSSFSAFILHWKHLSNCWQ